MTVDPLAPTATARTRFAFDLPAYGGTGPVLPISDALRSTAGTVLHLLPQTGAGFGLALRPDGAGGRATYLVPAGPFAVSPTVAAVANRGPPIADHPLELMCGVFGSEFLLLADRDVLDFVGANPAFAADFTAPSANLDDIGPLSSGYGTSWIQVIPGPNSGKVFFGAVKQSFCAQAFNAVYYQTSASGDSPLPTAIGARLADLSRPADGKVLPLPPYGRVYHSDKIIQNPNPSIPAETFVAFDNQVLSRARFAALSPDRCLGPLFFDMARLEALAGGYVRTRQGLVVSLNDGPLDGDHPAGTWKELLLARSPQNPAQLLCFRAGTTPSACPLGTGPYNVVSPYLSTALMDPAAVLFVADPTYLGAFDNKIQLGEFPIAINVAAADHGPDLNTNCVLIFKYATGCSLAELARSPATWASANYLVGDSAVIARISSQIDTYIAEAKAASAASRAAGDYDYFADFLARVEDPAWTGIIALNPPLDQQMLPADIQMLLCGMRGGHGLRCHHFGITANAGDTDDATVLQHSALFGLVHYDSAFQTACLHQPYDFQTLRLNALFDNSVVKHFDARIAFSIGSLFGDPPALSVHAKDDIPASNTVVIDGVLQVTDGITRVVFLTNALRAFSFPTNGNQYRVLSAQTVNSASLAPITTAHDKLGADGTVTVTAQFTLDGALGFATRAVGGGALADLFSYALDSDYGGGLGYSGYGFTMVSQVPPQGATPPPDIGLALGAVALDSSLSTPRQHSLLATLPLQVGGFSPAPNTGRITPVSGIGIDGVIPTYAVATQLVMGTLGGLSGSAPLDGQLLLGWLPGGNQNTADRIGVLLAPPASMQNGTFRLQGVLPTQYGKVEILRPKLNGQDTYVLVLRDVKFTLGAFPLYIPSTGERSLTFFGKPADDTADDEPSGGLNLSWFLGEPDLSSQSLAAVPTRPLPTEVDPPILSVVPAVYVVAGLKVLIDLQASSVVNDAVTKLSQVPLSTTKTLDAILAGTEFFPVAYDPAAGVSVAVHLQFSPVTFEFVFSDPYVYGARLAVEAAASSMADPPEKKGILNSLRGFALEIAYRKISDNLGAWSASFTFKKQIGTDDYYLLLPTIGLVIYTNSDFRIDIGWPFAPDGSGAQPLAVQFTIEGVPVRASAGLYLAKLRSADAPDVLGDKFGVIWRFGLGLSFGINKDIYKGPLYLNAGLIAFVTFEGFLASTHGSLTEAGVEYKWFAGQLGVMAYFTGGVDLKVVSASVSITATLALQVAYETTHATVISLSFHLSIYVEIHILFITISFSFDAYLDIFPPIKIGDGPPASIDGPDPYGGNTLLFDALAPEPTRLKQIHQALGRLRADSSADPRLPITLYLVLQPTTINTSDSQNGAPQAIAGLVINLLPDHEAQDDFSSLCAALADWLVASYGGTGTLKQMLESVAASLQDGAVDAAIGPFLSMHFYFKILPGTALPSQANFAAFPMLPQLMLVYGGTKIPFDSPDLPPSYATALRDYFSQLEQWLPPQDAARSAAALSAFPSSASGMVCTDMLALLAKQLISRLLDIATAHPEFTLAQALASLGPQGFANIAGYFSRFALHGVRLPTPDSHPFGSDLTGLYQLIGQQVALRQDADGWNTDFTLTFAPGQADGATWIGFGADGKADSIQEKLDPNLVLTNRVDPKWLAGGFTRYPPVTTNPTLFYLAQSIAWSNADESRSSILPFGDSLLARIAVFFAGGGTQASAVLRQTDAAPARSAREKATMGETVPASPALLVPLTLRQIVPDSNTEPLTDVFQLVGTDDATRALLDKLIAAKAFDFSLSFLIANRAGSYQTSAKNASLVLAKANLSTLNEPPTAAVFGFAARSAPAQPPSSATLADVVDFVTLVWEVSVVHANGFYMYMPDMPRDAFALGDAQVALLISHGAQASQSDLRPWYNSLLVTPALNPKNGAATVTVTDKDGAWSRYYAELSGWPGWIPDQLAAAAQPACAQRDLHARAEGRIHRGAI